MSVQPNVQGQPSVKGHPNIQGQPDIQGQPNIQGLPAVYGLLLEGISGTGKSSVLRALLGSSLFLTGQDLTTVVLTEHQTQRVLEKKERESGLTTSDNIGLLSGHLDYLESLRDRLDSMEWCRTDAVGMRIRFILERFHLTHVYHYSHISWELVAGIDERLANLLCRLCVLTSDEAALSSGLFDRRDANWLAYIQRFGTSKQQVLRHFLRQQDLLLELAAKSRLPTVILETGGCEPEDIVREIIDDWEAI